MKNKYLTVINKVVNYAIETLGNSTITAKEKSMFINRNIENASMDILKINEELLAQRDELLEACKRYVEAEQEHHGLMPVFMRQITNIIEEAIANATKGK